MFFDKSFMPFLTFPVHMLQVNSLEILKIDDGVFADFWIVSPYCSNSRISADAP